MTRKPPFHFGLGIGLIAGALLATIGLNGALVATPAIVGLWILKSVLTDPNWLAKRQN